VRTGGWDPPRGILDGMVESSPVPLPPRRRTLRNMTEQVAYELLRHIQQERMQPGERLGRAEDLARLFGVSRQTMREALGLLADTGLLSAHRGHGGGITVARTMEEGISHALAQSVAAMLDVAAISLRELVDARLILETATVRLAAERIDARGIAELAGIMDEIEHQPYDPATFQPADVRFHRAIARASGSVMLAAIVDWAFVVLQPRLYALTPPLGREALVPQHRAILVALDARDPDAAELAMRAHVEHVGVVTASAHLAELRTKPAPGDTAAAPRAPANRRSSANADAGTASDRATHDGGATLVASQLRAHIQHTMLEPGDRIGRESELAVQFGVSRPVLREGLRQLASSHLIRTSRGPGGGIFVANTFAGGAGQAMSDSVALLLETGAVSVEALLEARLAIEVPLASAAAATANADVARSLRESVETADAAISNRALGEACSTCFHRTIAQATNNRIIAAVTAWIWDALLPAFAVLVDGRANAQQLNDQHRELAAAIRAADGVAAERAMRDHLVFVSSLVADARR
jgi:GntR family transcriptional regulator, transcriptional repressor for pyruvate dehydrogenase complex